MRFVPKTTISAYPYVLGLTGSIGMGKSTVGKLLLDLRVPVQEADKAVHALYSVGGRAVDAVAKLFPSAVVEGASPAERVLPCMTHGMCSCQRTGVLVEQVCRGCGQESASLARSRARPG